MSHVMALPLRSVVEEKRDGVFVYQERRYVVQGWREQRSFNSFSSPLGVTAWRRRRSYGLIPGVAYGGPTRDLHVQRRETLLHRPVSNDHASRLAMPDHTLRQPAPLLRNCSAQDRRRQAASRSRRPRPAQPAPRSAGRPRARAPRRPRLREEGDAGHERLLPAEAVAERRFREEEDGEGHRAPACGLLRSTPDDVDADDLAHERRESDRERAGAGADIERAPRPSASARGAAAPSSLLGANSSPSCRTSPISVCFCGPASAG